MESFKPANLKFSNSQRKRNRRSLVDVYQGKDVSPFNQLIKQLAEPKPYDFDEIDTASYKGIVPPLNRWENVAAVCNYASAALADHLTEI